MTLPPLKPGDKVFVVHQRQRGQKEHRTETCEVVRVGSKYAYIKRYRREAAFFKNTGVSVHQDNNARLNGYGFDVYATEQDWLREQHEESEEARLTLLNILARLIQDRIMPNRWPTVAEIAEIISRHLFPVVKPEDVDDGFYWVKLPGYPWAIRQPWIHKDDRGETIMFNTYAASECEIRGPVPMPE